MTPIYTCLYKSAAKNFKTIYHYIISSGKRRFASAMVVKRIFDKLMQKVFYTTSKHKSAKIEENGQVKKKEILQPAAEKHGVMLLTAKI